MTNEYAELWKRAAELRAIADNLEWAGCMGESRHLRLRRDQTMEISMTRFRGGFSSDSETVRFILDLGLAVLRDRVRPGGARV